MPFHLPILTLFRENWLLPSKVESESFFWARLNGVKAIAERVFEFQVLIAVADRFKVRQSVTALE